MYAFRSHNWSARQRHHRQQSVVWTSHRVVLSVGRIRQYVTSFFREINSVGWYNDTVKNSSITTKNLYVDDILEVIKKGSVEKLTEFLNGLDVTGSIKFTYEVEQDGKLPFLDILLERTDSGGLKLSIYRKPTHTDQYLNFSSHHPVEHKLSVVRTLLERSQQLVTVSQDKTQEGAHVEEALRACGYPPWCFSKVRRQMEFKGDNRKKKNKKQEASVKRPMIAIPYVEKVSEATVRIMKKHNVSVAMKPWKTLKDFLVHPKDEQDKEDITERVQRFPVPTVTRRM